MFKWIWDIFQNKTKSGCSALGMAISENPSIFYKKYSIISVCSQNIIVALNYFYAIQFPIVSEKVGLTFWILRNQIFERSTQFIWIFYHKVLNF